MTTMADPSVGRSFSSYVSYFGAEKLLQLVPTYIFGNMWRATYNYETTWLRSEAAKDNNRRTVLEGCRECHSKCTSCEDSFTFRNETKGMNYGYSSCPVVIILGWIRRCARADGNNDTIFFRNDRNKSAKISFSSSIFFVDFETSGSNRIPALDFFPFSFFFFFDNSSVIGALICKKGFINYFIQS